MQKIKSREAKRKQRKNLVFLNVRNVEIISRSIRGKTERKKHAKIPRNHDVNKVVTFAISLSHLTRQSDDSLIHLPAPVIRSPFSWNRFNFYIAIRRQRPKRKCDCVFHIVCKHTRHHSCISTFRFQNQQ